MRKEKPLIGVTVIEKGTTNGAITDFDGNYSLSVPDAAVLQYSYVGYQTVEMSVAGKNVIDITMKEDTESAGRSCCYSIRYQTFRKALSYNVQQVNAEELTRNKDANFINSLSGKVAGVTINASSSGVGFAGYIWATSKVR